MRLLTSDSNMLSGQLFYGAVINPQSLTDLKALTHCLISVNDSGDIEWIIENLPKTRLQDTLVEKGFTDPVVIELQPGEFLIPGFIDTHIHAVQFPTLGAGGQDQLIDWLHKTIFPGEAKFHDKNLDYAQRVFKSVVRRTLDCGTTTACYYSSRHMKATKLLAETVLQYGQRGFVGKCNMDNREQCPDYLVDDCPESSLEETKEVIRHIRQLPNNNPPLVHPILSPRFAISCTEKLLTALGDYAITEPDLRIETHYAENKAEVELTEHLFESSYAAVYDKFHLLRPGTILGHGVHITSYELDLIKRRDAGIAHCPSSNLFLRSGFAPIGHYLDKGVKVGLSTDVSGGASPSMLVNIQEASKISKAIAGDKDPGCMPGIFTNRLLRAETLLYLATLGGADLCRMKDELGSFEEGKHFDAILVSTCSPQSGPSLWVPEDIGDGEKALCTLFERFLFCGDDRNVAKVWVQGKLVGGNQRPLD